MGSSGDRRRLQFPSPSTTQVTPHHPAASVLMERFLAGEWGTGLLLEYVCLEVVTVVMLRLELAAAVRFGRILLEAEELEFAPCSDSFLEAVDGFSRQDGTRLSFVDAALAQAARNRADGQILTFDAEFRKLHGMRVQDV